MSRTHKLTSRIVEQLGVAPEDLTVRHVDARGAPVADVERGEHHGRRFTDVGPRGSRLHEIIDDQRGGFVSVPVVLAALGRGGLDNGRVNKGCR